MILVKKSLILMLIGSALLLQICLNSTSPFGVAMHIPPITHWPPILSTILEWAPFTHGSSMFCNKAGVQTIYRYDIQGKTNGEWHDIEPFSPRRYTPPDYVFNGVNGQYYAQKLCRRNSQLTAVRIATYGKKIEERQYAHDEGTITDPWESQPYPAKEYSCSPK